jgi:hypothetical protein
MGLQDGYYIACKRRRNRCLSRGHYHPKKKGKSQQQHLLMMLLKWVILFVTHCKHVVYLADGTLFHNYSSAVTLPIEKHPSV